MMNANSHALLVFSSTLFVYLGHRYYKLKSKQIKKESNRILWMKRNNTLVLILLVSSALVSAILGIQYCSKHSNIIGWGVVATLITYFYVVRIKNRNLREIPYLKNIWVVLVYWFIVVGLTGFSLQVEEQPHFYLYINQLLYIFAVAILFDIPDITIDSVDQKTIPQVIGVRASVYLSIIASCCFVVYLGYSNGMNWQFISFTGVLTLFYINFRKTKDMEFYLSFYGDGILGILGLYYFLI